MPTVGGKKDREAKREELLHWWNLIHLIDSKWSNSDLARLGRLLSAGIKSSCPGENGDSRRAFKEPDSPRAIGKVKVTERRLGDRVGSK